ncbi:MAG: pacearchaeosortase [Candidatus Pacearchaeota archaeon]|jgi:exosortase/archaeosortase family protein
MKNSKLFNLFLRYIFILLLGLGELFIIYFIFTPLTVYPVYLILNLFFKTALNGIVLTVNNYGISIVEACVAGSAYYLLFILNFAVPMQAKKRILSLAYSVFALLILNILRIVILSVMLVNSSVLFDFTHKFFWYFLSTAFVVIIWFSEVKLFKIKEIPAYSDIKLLMKIISHKN